MVDQFTSSEVLYNCLGPEMWNSYWPHGPLWEFTLDRGKSTTTGLICTILRSVKLSLSIDVQQHGHWPFRPHDESITITAGPHWVQCHWNGGPQLNATGWGSQIGTSPLTSSCPVFVQQLKCSTSNTHISCIRMRGVGTALSPTSYTLLSCRKLILIYIIVISGKMYLWNFSGICT